MGNLTDAERPSDPRHLAYLLPKAIAAFIAADWTDRTKMLVPAWAATFHCGVDQVRAEWDRQMSVKSQTPDNAFDCEGK
jgi:hypothetical protein